MKRIFKSLMVICMIISTLLYCPYSTLASEGIESRSETGYEKEYFYFLNPTENRIDPNGYFTFSFSNAMPSGLFKPASSTISVYISATSSNTNQTYYLALYEGETFLGSRTLTANGHAQLVQFSGLDTQKMYSFYFSKPIFSGNTITGSGNVSPIAAVY